MSKRLRAARTALLAMAAGGALGFGATQALANPAEPDCAVSWAAGTCHTTRQCRDICLAQGSNPTFSECRDNCCYCDIQ